MRCDDSSKDRSECGFIRNQARALEKEYLRIRLLLQETEVKLRKNPQNSCLQEKINDLRQRQSALESQARFGDDYPLEFALSADPHG